MTSANVVDGYGFGEWLGRVKGTGETLQAAFQAARAEASELGAHAVVAVECAVDLETLQFTICGSAARLVDRGWQFSEPSECGIELDG